MHPLFIAHGPAFKSGFKIDSFRNVDIYPLMCHILDVEPATHNGTLDNVAAMLSSNSFSYPNFGKQNHHNESMVYKSIRNPTFQVFMMLFVIPFGLLMLTLAIIWFINKFLVTTCTKIVKSPTGVLVFK
jgi:hypothetical protein